MTRKGILMDMSSSQVVTKPDLKIWIGIIGSTVSICATVFISFFSISNQIALLTQKVDQKISVLEENKTLVANQLRDLEGRYGRSSLDIQVIKTILRIK